MSELERLDLFDSADITKPHLEQLEQIVRDGLQSFMAVGLALIEIRESGGYRLRGFDTFEAYCQETFGFTARHGRRMMQAARTNQEIVRATGQTLKRESVARALKPLWSDHNAIRHVKARLEARGQSFGHSSAAVVAGIVNEVLDRTPVAQMIEIGQNGKCPECGDLPRAYRFVGGVWQCGSCGEEVSLNVLSVRSA
jgi:hypothetical protein